MPILPVIQNQWAPVESICYWRPIVQILILYDWYSFLQTPSSSYTEWCMLAVTWFLCHKDTYIASPDNLVFTGTRIHKLKVIQRISCCTGTKQNYSDQSNRLNAWGVEALVRYSFWSTSYPGSSCRCVEVANRGQEEGCWPAGVKILCTSSLYGG